MELYDDRQFYINKNFSEIGEVVRVESLFSVNDKVQVLSVINSDVFQSGVGYVVYNPKTVQAFTLDSSLLTLEEKTINLNSKGGKL